jgi:hypothetical protein
MQLISKQRDQVRSSVTIALSGAFFQRWKGGRSRIWAQIAQGFNDCVKSLVSIIQSSSHRRAFKKPEDADEPQDDRTIAVLQHKLRAALHGPFGVFAREVSVFRSASAGMRGLSDKVSALKRQIVAIRLRNNF